MLQRLVVQKAYVKPVYKTVSQSTHPQANSLKFKETIQKWLQRPQNDAIAKILLKNSNLTKIQLETLLIDILAENYAEKPLNYDEKGGLRLTKVSVSRGAFNRTLNQAKKNITESIYTILLLGYLGVMQTTSLAPYLEVANKLQSYTDAHKDLLERKEVTIDQWKIINTMREELTTMLAQLENPKP
jgi:hypothetical protein